MDDTDLADALPPLKDRIRPGVRVLFVGINPGIRSSQTGRHFAGFSNRFWMLLFESRLVPERITYEDDDRLAEWGYGITNIVPRPTPGIDTILPHARKMYEICSATAARDCRRRAPAAASATAPAARRTTRPGDARSRDNRRRYRRHR